MARPWEKSITSSSVPWMTRTGDVTLDALSILKRQEKERKIYTLSKHETQNPDFKEMPMLCQYTEIKVKEDQNNETDKLEHTYIKL